MQLNKFTLDGKEYHLLLNGEALFDCYERFGQDKGLLDVLDTDGRDGYAAAAFLLATFSMQGELYRRWQGEDRGSYLSEAQARVLLTPADIPTLRVALIETIMAGFERKHPDDGPVDPWLNELTQKKTKESAVHNIFAWSQKLLGSTREKA